MQVGGEQPRDLLSRPLRDLRVSVTDRCNFRCRYCMPREVFGADHAFLPRSELLTFEEIARVVAALTPLGVRKVRLTGGEPLLRRNVPALVAMLAGTAGVEDLALTTNGSLLTALAEPLRDAGLRRITVSLDSVDPQIFADLSDTKIPLQTVLSGIARASSVGFRVKINTVVQRGVNDAGLLDLVDYARSAGHTLRFIEYMDVGSTNGWLLDEVVPAVELVQRIGDRYPLEAVGPAEYGEVAKRYRFTDGAGEVGFVTSVTQPFCGSCTRLRLSAVGELYTCLFGTTGYDLRTPLRDGASDEELAAQVSGLWTRRADRYSEVRGARTRTLSKVEMSYIGG
ncbi:MAG TPA: GTP 3',8-cyclase MoaA [Frankiaceae bacterium]|nr:GTP 3',8-cyclase MoaA [Frankiaceae bacterium]